MITKIQKNIFHGLKSRELYLKIIEEENIELISYRKEFVTFESETDLENAQRKSGLNLWEFATGFHLKKCYLNQY